MMFLLAVAPVIAGVVSFEATSFPEAPWERSTFCTPERWIANGYFFQQVDAPGECGPPPGGDRDSYTRSIAEFDGEAEFFIEWRIMADGPSSEFTGVAPAVLSAWSFGDVNYLFVIARDQAKLNRDNLLPIVFVDIEPGVPHTYRLELHGAARYVWFIDGVIVDSGVPEGAFPSFFPSITWRAFSWNLSSTTQWDYIRYGTIPQPASGDFNSDGLVDTADLFFFTDCLLGPDAAGPGCQWADINNDGTVNGNDIQPFADAMLAP